MHSPVFPTRRTAPAMLTDLYQLTMAQGYWRAGTANREAAFHLYFRINPFRGGRAVACGLADAIEGAAIDVWRVGTKLVTGSDQAALGGAFKLSAIRRSEGRWEYKIRLQL